MLEMLGKSERSRRAGSGEIIQSRTGQEGSTSLIFFLKNKKKLILRIQLFITTPGRSGESEKAGFKG